MARSYFEGLVFLFFGILVRLVIMFSMIDVLPIYALGNSVLRRVIPFLRSSVDNGYVGRDVIDIYYLNFLIRIFFDKIALLSVL